MVKSIKLNNYTLIAVLLLCCIVVTAFALYSGSSIETVAEVEFEEVLSLRVGHISDTHYYPMRYTHNNMEEGVFYKNMKADTKILMESSTVYAAILAEVLDNPPDILLVSGDLTKDGERASHMDVANSLRKLQNDVRAKTGNVNFQIIVSFGNHDLYNHATYSYGGDGLRKDVPTVTRKDLSILYSSLGFPDITNTQADNFYTSVDYAFNWDTLPYTVEGATPFVNSTTAPNMSIVYEYIYNDNQNEADYVHGELSFIAYTDDYAFISLDVQDSNPVDGHVLTGSLPKSTKQFMDNNKPLGVKTMFTVLHHNTVKQYSVHDTILNGFINKDWVMVADYLADYGIRYSFTGHKHVNSIAHHVSFYNNQITDFETAGAVSYMGGVRYVDVVGGTYGEDWAEDVSTEFTVLREVDFSYLIDNNYVTEDYLIGNNLLQYVNMDTKKCTNFSEYARLRIYDNVIDNYMIKFLSPEIIVELGPMVSDILPDKFMGFSLNAIKNIANQLILNLVSEIDAKVLADYVYGGDNPLYQNGQNKLLGFTEEIVNRFRDLEVADDGTTVFELAMDCFYRYIRGEQVSHFSELPLNIQQGIINLQNGKAVKEVIDLLIDKEQGLYYIIEGLLSVEMDLTEGMTSQQIYMLNTLVKNILGVSDFDLKSVVVDELIMAALAMFEFDSLEIGDKGIIAFLDKMIDSYLTTSLYTGLGDIAANVMLDFSVSDTVKADYDKPLTIRLESDDMFTYLSSGREDKPTIANGKLPSMLTVSFGEDASTDKNMIWFTDRRIDNSYIIYSTNEDMSNATKVDGISTVYAHYYAQIDLGIFATYGVREIARHSVELTGLTAGTKYYYKVGSTVTINSETYDYASPVYSMTTAPNDDSAFEVLLMADLQGFTQRNYDDVFEVLNNVDKVFKNGFDFSVIVGDDVDNSRNIRHYEYLLNTNQAFWANTSYVTSTGNHETYSFSDEDYTPSMEGVYLGPYNSQTMHFNPSIPPQNDSVLTGMYYSFVYSGVEFIVLNTNDIDEDNKLGHVQYNWLLDVLEASTAKHKVVIMHKSLYSAGSHSYDKDVIAMRAQLTPLFSDNGVNLVLGGHDHTYSLTYYLDRDGNPIKGSHNGKTRISDVGTLYVTLGTIGNKFYNWQDNEDVPVFFGKELHDPTLDNPVFGRLVYDGSDLFFEAYQYDLATGEITQLLPKKYTALIVLIAISVIVFAGAVAIVALYYKNKRVVA